MDLCLSRAASSLESDAHYRSADYLALRLVPTFLKLLLHVPLIRRVIFRGRIFAPQGIYEYTIARTKYIFMPKITSNPGSLDKSPIL